MMRILLVEDNPDLAYGLRNNLEIEGYDVQVEVDGEAGLAAALADGHDLIVLDLMMPGIDGFRVLRTLRDRGVRTPVLVLTARGDETDKVRGLRLGADDYVTKPFGLLEFLARVEALLRRAGISAESEMEAAASESYRLGEVLVDVPMRRVTRDGVEVSLTPMELDLLVALCRRGGRVATRLELLKEVWGHLGEVLTRTVDTHISELRRKLEPEPSQPSYIITVRKVGYRVECEPGAPRSK